jgi:hypothetical protein
MKLPLVILLAFFSFSVRFGFTQTTGYCPTSAVFLALGDEVRGYSARANGSTEPCQILHGGQTTFFTARAISISGHDYLHVAQFLTDGTINLFPPYSYGNVAPSRTVSTYTNDLIAIATNSNTTDFILSNRARPSEIVVVPDQATTPVGSFYLTQLQSAWSLAIDATNNLLVGGYDANGVATVDTYNTSINRTAPLRVRRLQGDATGLLPGDPEAYAGNTIAIALDPVTQELYVYNTDADSSTIQVSVFPARANGNVAPTRVIHGPATQIGVPGFLGTGKIAVSSDGRLFDAEPNNRILVFAPGASGDVAPSQIIQDSTIGSTQVGQGGIAVRSCDCE